MKPVKMYTSSYCPFCVRAEQLLQKKGVTPEKINIEADPALQQEMMEKTGRRSVPQIFIGTQHVGGFDDLSALDRKGELDLLLAE